MSRGSGCRYCSAYSGAVLLDYTTREDTATPCGHSLISKELARFLECPMPLKPMRELCGNLHSLVVYF